MQKLLDMLFRFSLYRGTTVTTPRDLVTCKPDYKSKLLRRYYTDLNPNHELAEWLLHQCDGPWAIRMQHPYHYRKTNIAFARAADALVFRMRSSGG